MGDALRVQTRFPTATELLNVVGSALERGSLRLPLHLKLTTPFEVTLLASDGVEAIRGTAEIVEHAGHATWVRFLSAAPERAGDDSARCMLADVDVDITGPQEAVVEPVAASSSEAFEAITAVNTRPPAFAAIGNAEPVPLLPPPPELLPPPTAVDEAPSIVPGAPESSALKGIEPIAPDVSTPEPAAATISDAVRQVEPRTSDAMTAPIPVETMAQVIDSKPVVVDDSHSDAETSGEVETKTDTEVVVDAKGELEAKPDDVSSGAAVAVVTEDAEAIYVNEKRDTEASPPMVIEHAKDSIARERGIEPIAEPYVRDSMPVVPQEMPRARRVIIASMAFAGVCLAVGGGAIIWAQDAVAEAQMKPAPAAMVIEEPPPAARAVQPVQAREADTMVTMPVATPTPATCSIVIDSSVVDSRVRIGGKDRGLAPATATVPCGQPVDIEVRHPRYATYATSMTVTGERQALRAKLEREKTTVTLTSDPPATVTLNGVAIGKTPMTTTVSRFERTTFRFNAPGYVGDWRRIQPKTGTSAVILKLQRRR